MENDWSGLWQDADELVQHALDGYVRAFGHLIQRDAAGRIARRQPKQADRVALVIGNGLGHEPAMAGLVGPGLFDLNVPGRLFEAPPATRLRDGVAACDRDAGVLLCVSNHSGDVLNAEMALEDYESQLGPVDIAILGDDVGSAPAGRREDRRGTAGLLFTWKIVGAAAEAGADLRSCRELATRVAGETRSLGAALAAVTNPITGDQLVAVPNNCAVIGTGVHGEAAGATLERPTAHELVCALLDPLVDDLAAKGADQPMAFLLNDAGGLAPTERAALHNVALQELELRGIEVRRSWFGQYATTFNLRGLSLSLLPLDQHLQDLYDAPCQGAALASHGRGPVG